MIPMNLVGETFGRLTVIERATPPVSRVGRVNKNPSYWKCRCQCGAITFKWGHNLTTGKSKSCGCYRDHVLSKRTADDYRKRKKRHRKIYVPCGVIQYREARMPMNSAGAVSVRHIMMPFSAPMV